MIAKLRFAFKLIVAYTRRFKGVLLLSILLGGVLFLVLNLLLPRLAPVVDQKIGVIGRFTPEELPSYVLSYLSRGLTKLDKDESVLPDLATSFETPDKGKTWIFKLGDYYWKDGTPLQSSDLDFKFQDVEIDRPDSKTIVFKLKDPFAPFPSIVTRPIFKKGLLGIGDWEVKKLVTISGHVQELVLKNADDVERIFRFYPTADRTKLSFKLGETDTIKDIIDPKPFTLWNTVNIVESEDVSQVVTIFLNTKDDVLSEKSVRQALAYAIEKDYYTARALAPISKNSWSYNAQVKPYEYDPARAKELLNDAIPKELKANFTLKLATTPILLSTAERIAQNWRDVGIPTSVQVSSVTPTDFQAFLTIYDIPNDPDQYAMWHSTQVSNLSKYGSPRLDKLLEEGRVTIDRNERKKIYLDFQRFLLEDLPAIFLFYPTYYTIERK